MKVQLVSAVSSGYKKLVAALPENNIKLFSINPQQGGVYNGLKLFINGKSAVFNWKSDSNPTFHPKLYFKDLNNDSKNELIIILTTGSGSDLHIEEIHIINPYNFSEIKVENPLDIINNNVETSITKQNNDVLIQISLNNKIQILKRKISYAGLWFENIGFGFLIHYAIKDNLLIVRVAAQISPSGFVGDIIITYKFLDNKYVLKDIMFEDY